MRSNPMRGVPMMILLGAALVGACAPQYSTARATQALTAPQHVVQFVGVDADWIPEDVRHELAWIRSETKAFESLDAARAAGYTEQVTQCMSSANGGQGVHYGNPDLIADGARLDPLRPELLMYEPQADGSMQLVGIEYIVPFKDWKKNQPPRLMGRQFHRNESFGIWVLHVWWRDNPAGQFTNWNPEVTCG